VVRERRTGRCTLLRCGRIWPAPLHFDSSHKRRVGGWRRVKNTSDAFDLLSQSEMSLTASPLHISLFLFFVCLFSNGGIAEEVTEDTERRQKRGLRPPILKEKKTHPANIKQTGETNRLGEVRLRQHPRTTRRYTGRPRPGGKALSDGPFVTLMARVTFLLYSLRAWPVRASSRRICA
jgi:hypothetical protein